jgi:hypothetical protein
VGCHAPLPHGETRHHRGVSGRLACRARGARLLLDHEQVPAARLRRPGRLGRALRTWAHSRRRQGPAGPRKSPVSGEGPGTLGERGLAVGRIRGAPPVYPAIYPDHGYQAANEWWQAKRRELDAKPPHPHQDELDALAKKLAYAKAQGLEAEVPAIELATRATQEAQADDPLPVPPDMMSKATPV